MTLEQKLIMDLALAIIDLAEDAGMPDSYFETDSRVLLARGVLDDLARGTL